MQPSGEWSQRKTLMRSSIAMMAAIVAGLPGKWARTEAPLALDRVAPRRNKEPT